MSEVGTCPRCGSKPAKRVIGMNRSTRSANKRGHGRNDDLDLAYGTLYDTEFDEWSCQDCGCQFNAEGVARSLCEEWGIDDDEWSNGGRKTRAAKGAQ